ncbi:hypothetical protein [Sorangium sp. So ce1024]|uniref:hypothetical protein n=1 Tax=Sorangium sp. So ce1024 TaxID=3133327 RepID=UPI003F0059E7
MMVYDFDGDEDRSPPPWNGPECQPTDLDAIVMALEIAAINLTPTTAAEFTRGQLLDEAVGMGVDRAATESVVDRVPFLEKRGDRLRLV